MISRRRLIVGGLGAVGVAGLAAWGLGRLGFQVEIASILRRRLGFLKLDEAGVRALAKDQTHATFGKKIATGNRLRDLLRGVDSFFFRVPAWTPARHHWRAPGSSSVKRFYRSPGTRSRMGAFEDALVATYLLS